jgi:glycosyltransferase involved in cell wall biosynthesis
MRANTVYVLSRDPLIVAGGFGTIETLKGVNQPFTLIYHNCGLIRAHHLSRYMAWDRAYSGKRRLVVVTNEPAEARWLRLVGIDSHALSHNIHVRDGFFSPDPACEKRYDAVYVAQLASFKRLWLAKGIQRLFVMTYVGGGAQWDLHEYEPSLSHASFNRTWVPPDGVRDVYRESHVGLALSAKEGAMFASMEYLMTGLPVVTTKNRGGRDRYLTPLNSRFVAARPDAVARAVSDFVASPPDPMEIRQEVLGLVRRDRLAYVEMLRKRCSMRMASADSVVEQLWGGELGIERHAMPVQDFVDSTLTQTLPA